MPDIKDFKPQYQEIKATYYEPLTEIDPNSIDKEYAWLFNRRPGYHDDLPLWRFLRESYEGGQAWVNSRNLPPHTIEMKQAGERLVAAQEKPESAGASSFETRTNYEMRLEQAFRPVNVPREVMSTYDGFVEAHEPTLSLPPGIPELSDFCKEADFAKSESLSKIAQRAVMMSTLLKNYYVGLDGTATPEEVEAALRTITPDANGRYPKTRIPDNRPYCWTIDPSRVLNGIIDQRGYFEEALIAECRHNGKSLKDGAAIETYKRYWTTRDWELYRIYRQQGDKGKWTAEMVANGPNLLGIVPVFRACVWPNPNDPWGGLGIFDDDVRTDQAMAGLISSLVYSLGNDSETQVIGSADLSEWDDQPETREMYTQQLKEAVRSPYGFFHKSITFDVLNKWAGQRNLMLETWLELARFVLQLRGLGSKLNLTDESGIALLRRFQMLNPILAKISEAQARLMRDVLYGAALMVGDEKAGEKINKETVTHVEKFDILTVEDLVVIDKEWRGGGCPPEWEREIKWKIWLKLFGSSKSDDFMRLSREQLERWEPSSVGEIMSEFKAEANRPEGGFPPVEEEELVAEEEEAPL